MNTAHILAAHRAHVAAHGPECGRGSGVRNDPCSAIFRAWLHLSTGEWRATHPVEQSLRGRQWRDANKEHLKVYTHDYQQMHREAIATYRKEHPRGYTGYTEAQARANLRWRASHREQWNTYNREYMRKRRAAKAVLTE